MRQCVKQQGGVLWAVLLLILTQELMVCSCRGGVQVVQMSIMLFG